MTTTKTEPARPRPIVPLLPYQRADLESPARFRWCCWARQTGKSFTKSLRRILRGLDRRRNQIFLSAGERQSRELMDKARMHCQALKIAYEFLHGDDFGDLAVHRMEIRLPGGVRIIGLPANPGTARGFSGDVLLDEFAMHEHDREIWAAMFPTLLRHHGELDVASTPHGRNNVFYRLSKNDRFSHSTVTLRDAVAQGLDVDETEVREAMGDDFLFRQEFLCEFADEATAFLSHERVAACVDENLTPAAAPGDLAAERRELFVGVDIGRHRDLTVIWVAAKDGELLETVGLFELAGTPFREQSALLAEVLSLRAVRRCCIDAGGLGMQLAEEAVQRFGPHRVEAVTFTPALKSQLAGGLRLAVEAGTLRIPRDPRIQNDWTSVERAVGAGGQFRFAAPRRDGSHADRFWAAALAVFAASDLSGPPEVLTVAPLQFAREGSW